MHGRRKGGQDPQEFGIIGKKRCFFQLRGMKTKFQHFWPQPWKNFWEKPLLALPGKDPSDAHVQISIQIGGFC